MTMTVEKDRDLLLKEASEWLAYIYSDEASEEGLSRFKVWIRADLAHETAFREVNAAFEAIDQLDQVERHLSPVRSSDQPAVVPIATARKPKFGLVSGVAAGLSAAAAAVLLFISLPQSTPEPYLDTRLFETGVGEVRTVALPDGSSVTLGAKSKLAFAMTDTGREAVLETGRAYFDVMRDESRRFDVTVGETEVRVLGTAFDIRRGPETVSVSVTAGLVEVRDRVPEEGVLSEPLFLRPGEQVFADLMGSLSQPQNIRAEDVLSWRDGRLAYADSTLVDIVADAQRYHRGEIRIEDPEIADMRITTSFRTDNLDQLFSGLEATGEIAVERRPRGLIVLSAPGDPFEEED